MMFNVRTWLAIAFALPISLFALGAIVIEVRDQLDPCFVWGGGTSYHVNRESPCAGRVVHADVRTRTQAVVVTVAVPGVILIAAILGICGAARCQRQTLFIAACLMTLEAAPTVFSVMPLALVAGGGFAYLGNRISGGLDVKTTR